MYILAIDPGNVYSAYCVIDVETYKPIEFGKILNEFDAKDVGLRVLMKVLINKYDIKYVTIEMIASYGMGVGKSVFDTCVWIGRFKQIAIDHECHVEYIYRSEEKMNICHSMKAKDSNIRQALIDRFGEVGTKNNKGFFYGFKADIWAAFAVGVTYIDKITKGTELW